MANKAGHRGDVVPPTSSAHYVDVEQAHSNLANLYVANYRVHESLERREVLFAIQEIIIRLIGSEEFALFERDGDAGPLSLTASFGIDPARALHAEAVEGASRSGVIYVCPEPDAEAPGRPRVCIPLKVGKRVTGVIAIYRLLGHKRHLEPLDHELFHLLEVHAGIALFSSGLYARFEARGVGR